MVRRIRGAVYRIRVVNPDGVHRGVVRVVADGRALETNVVPYADGGEHRVEVTLGLAAAADEPAGPLTAMAGS